MNDAFSLRRLGLLMRGDLVARYRTLLIVSATLAALMLLNGVTNAYSDGSVANPFAGWFVGMLLIWGSIAASMSFRELHDKTKNEAYLLLPASALEKTVARLLAVTVGLGIYIFVLTLTVSWISWGVNLLLSGQREPTFRLAGGVLVFVYGHFLVNQSLYFLGAAWFRKSHLLKTALALTAISIGLSIVIGVVARIFLGDALIGAVLTQNDIQQRWQEFYFANQSLLYASWQGMKIVYFFVLPLFCWFVAWLRVKEAQVSHGV